MLPPKLKFKIPKSDFSHRKNKEDKKKEETEEEGLHSHWNKKKKC